MSPRVPSRSALLWLAALALLAALHASVVASWARRDTRPLAWDQSIHTRAALEYRDRLRGDAGPVELLKPTYFNYPPLYHLSMIPFLDRVADIADAGAAANGFYLALLIFSVFYLAQPLVGSPRAFLAAALVSCYPITAELARESMIDLAVTAWVAAGMLCLLRSEDFSRRGWSIAFGVATALGMLTKWTTPAYLIAPAIVSLWHAGRERRWANILLSAGALVVLSAPWYLINLIPMLSRIGHNSGLPPASGRFTDGLAYYLWYPIALVGQLNVPFLLLLIPGLIAAIRRPRYRPILLWFAVPMILFTLIVNRNERYSMPVLPAVAVLSVAWLSERRRWPILAVGAMTALFFGLYHFGLASPLEWYAGRFPVGVVAARPPLVQDWKHEEIIARVAELRSGQSGFTPVTTVSNAAYFHSTTMNISLARSGVGGFSFRGPSKRRWLDFAEYVVVKTGDLGPDFTVGTVGECAAFLANPPDWFPRAYKEDRRWDLPDGSQAVLYRWDPDPVRFSGVDALTFEVGEMELPRIRLENVVVRAVPSSDADSRLGRFRELTLSCDTLDYRGVQAKDVRLRISDPVVNLHRPLDGTELPQVVSVASMEPSFSISSHTVLAYARKKAEWLKDPSVAFEGPVIHLSGSAGVPIEIALRLELTETTLTPHLDRVRVAGIPLPRVLFVALVNRPFPLTPNREMPFRLPVRNVEGRDGSLRVESL